VADFRSRAPRCRSFRPAAAGSSRPGNPAAKDPVALDALQVTAQRRVENAKDVPVALSAIQGEKLDVLGSAGDDIRFLAARVPSLNIESSYGRAFPRFYIRGLGNTDFDLNASQPVSLVYDDVVQESPLLKGFPLFDLANVEVLRARRARCSAATPRPAWSSSIRRARRRTPMATSRGLRQLQQLERAGRLRRSADRSLVGTCLGDLPAPRRLGRQHPRRRSQQWLRRL
jgi:hypothetical protein